MFSYDLRPWITVTYIALETLYSLLQGGGQFQPPEVWNAYIHQFWAIEIERLEHRAVAYVDGFQGRQGKGESGDTLRIVDKVKNEGGELGVCAQHELYSTFVQHHIWSLQRYRT